jgi:hypothetical protein
VNIRKELFVAQSRHYLSHLLEGTEYNHEKPVRIATVLAKIQIEYLPNESKSVTAMPTCSAEENRPEIQTTLNNI